MIDSKNVLYLPWPFKALALAVLGVAFAASILVAISFVGRDGASDWILFALATAQVATTAFAFLVVILFSQRDANIRVLQRQTRAFLSRQLPRFLARITVPDVTKDTVKVRSLGDRDIFGHLYEITIADRMRYRLMVAVNVRRLIAVYFVKLKGDPADRAARAREVFDFTFAGAEKVGYTISYQETVREGEPLVSIWLTTDTGEDEFLTSPAKKLFWAQDLAMMTQSFLRTAVRHADDVEIDFKAEPSTL